MWLRVLVAVSVTTQVWSQHAYANQRVQQNGKGFEWSWQLTPVDSVPADQFYVQLSQPVQGVQYASNVGVLQNTAPLLDGSGQATVGYNHAVPVQIYENPSLANNTQIIHSGQSNGNSEQTPVDIYLLQQQFSLPVYQTVQGSLPGDLVHYNNIQPNVFNLNTLNHNFQTNHQITNSQQAIEPQNNDRSSKDVNPITSLQEIDAEQNQVPITSVVQVFRDHNCSNEDLKTANEFDNYMQKSTELVAEISTYDKQNINENFGDTDRQNEPYYKGATDFKIEQPRDNTNNVGYYYYSTETSPISTENTNTKEQDGISRLVASTQDLISNDDLLRINHSAEKHVTEIYDDYIKPRSRFNLKSEETRYIENPRNHITVKAKISNIENRAVESSNNDATDDNKIRQDNYESDKFTSPIVVQDFNDADYKEQILNTLVSTMAPYIENGYEIVNIKKDSKGNYTNIYVPHYFNEETVYVTPRPLGQRYLAPITVALRLLNSNHTEDLNSIDDHDTSDTELVEETVKSPSKERTIVEIQQSIPLDITHINDIEVHEYLEEGRSNSNPFDVAKTLYNTYMKVLQFTKKNEENINEVFNKYDTKNIDENSDSNYNDDDPRNENNHETEEKLEPSENMQSEVHFNINSDDINDNGYKNENNYDNHNANDRKAIQPIIIEKEMPVPQYINRYIDKQVPEPVEVVKHVPVDRPVPVPVPYEKVIEKPVEVTKYIEKPYPVQVPQPYPVAVKVPYPVEQKVYIDRPVQVPYPVEKLVEKQIIKTVPVPTPVAIPFKVHVPVEKPVLYPVEIEKPILLPIEKPVPVEKIVHREVPVPYPVEKTILYPVPYEKLVRVPYPVEKQVPFPVEKIVEKPVQVTQVVEKPVHVNVPVPVPVHIEKHYPVDRIVEKKVPYLFPVDRIVEKRVPVKDPYPVEKVVEKLVQKPVVFTKYIDRPYPVETKVPHIVEKINEKKLPYAVQIPYTATSSTHGNSEQESQNLPYYYQYHGQSKQNPTPVQNNQDHRAQQGFLNQYYQYLKERQQTYSVPVQTTQWGKLYASSFNYLNVTPEDSKDTKKTNDGTYLTINENTYYGPPPVQIYDNMWEKNNNHISEEKLKRNDRTPKVTNIRLEYGFKPPLIPSTEVDLDGRPIHKESET